MSEPGREGPNPPQEAPAGLAGTVLRGAGLGGLGYGASQALTLGIYIVLARLITPDEFGDFAAATVLIGFTLLVTETGMMSAIVQRRSRVEEAANTAFLATLASGVVFTGDPVRARTAQSATSSTPTKSRNWPLPPAA